MKKGKEGTASGAGCICFLWDMLIPFMLVAIYLTISLIRLTERL
jgi:hypothetical protein